MSEKSDAKKFDNGKAPIDLLSSAALIEIARVMDQGAVKYGRFNWAKGLNFSRVLSAAQRHLLAWNNGEDLDPETGISHVAHAACNCLFLLDYLDRGLVELDDRRPVETRKKK